MRLEDVKRIVSHKSGDQEAPRGKRRPWWRRMMFDPPDPPWGGWSPAVRVWVISALILGSTYMLVFSLI